MLLLQRNHVLGVLNSEIPDVEVQGCWVGMVMVVQWLYIGGSCLGMSRDNSTRSPNHGFVGQPGALRIILHI